jgi:serpin B
MKSLIIPFIVLAFPSFAVAQEPAAPAEWRQADFAANAYRQAVALAGKGGNVVLSPWSVAALYGALQIGARGDTAREMARALQLGGNETPAPDAVAATFREARACLARAANADVALEMSDSLWIQLGFNVRTDFTKRLQGAFDASLHSVEDWSVGRTAINDFVSEKTHGRIKELIQPGSLDRETSMVAVDTVYFKAKWQAPFKKRDTQDQAFHAPSGDAVVPFMHATRSAEILDAPECAALRLPYRSSETEMLVVLPSPTNTLAEVEAKISGAWLDRLGERPWRGMADIALPKFDFESEHNLKALLVPMGMAAPFELSANFHNIAPGRLFISVSVQKANVTVDEEGTEAAAASFAVLSRGRPAEPPPVQRSFVADRPFLFLIRETSTGLILFVGRVTKP